MKKWLLKAIVQKTISYLPYSNRINYFFQKYVTKGVYLTDDYFADRLGHARDHIAAYQKYADGSLLTSALEIGTGWYPVVPIALFLYGAERLLSVDVSQLTNARRLQTTLQKFLEFEARGTLRDFVDCRPERLAVLKQLAAQPEATLEEILQALHITCLIQDARRLSLPSGYIDLVNSNNTFEHIYPDILAGILAEFKRVTRHGGIMSHFIDLSDHFAHLDKSITIYNFLRFSKQQWHWLDNSIQPLNRLRLPEYRAMYAQLDIPITHEVLRPGSVTDLRRIKLHRDFDRFSIEENAVSHCHLISAL